MEKIPQSLTNEISRLNKNIYFSELVSSVLVIENLSLDFYKYENIQNLFKIILLLVDKTESKIEIALFINKELKYKKEEEAYIYEKFAYIIYTLANKLRFITEKNLIVSFPSYFNKSLDPQLYLKQKYKIELENSSYLDDKKYLYALKINLGDTSILDEISKAFITDRNIVFDQLLFDKLMEKYFINQECKELKFYSYVTMGGSFDHVHIGHNILLNKAALITNTKLGIGITSDQMISKKCPEYIRQPYSYRSDRITKFMIEIGFFNREINQETELQIYKIEDTKGNAGQQETLEALVLSIETLQGLSLIHI